jgi:para-aminobenzoate synthetase/4-amino-4-deoxychorismate lyase
MLLYFESLRPDDKVGRSFCVVEPEHVLQAFGLDEVDPLLEEVERRVQEGSLAAGFLCYEAGFAFLPRMPEAEFFPDLPLGWFALTRKPVWDRRLSDGEEGPVTVEELRLNRELEEYAAAIGEIRRHIEEGETYQVNYTLRYRGRLSGTPVDLYRRLRGRQRVNYACCIQTDDWSILSLSPELFFCKEGPHIWMRPMKGTSARGKTVEEDIRMAECLQNSLKERSENAMIVDLLRSDLGRVCEIGSVRVADPMRVERYETLLQMTSTVFGELAPETRVRDLLHAVFPSGSVTGAPKIRTMQIIHRLEQAPRGIYTGAIGYMHGDRAVFNVAIRTVHIHHGSGNLEMGTGSGILYEADALREYRECELKGKFLTDPPLRFQLLETILWTPGSGFHRLELHMQRLSQSAEYFLFVIDLASVREKLASLPDNSWQAPRRIRLLVSANGSVDIESEELLEMETDPVVTWAEERVDSSDPFLYHKTTHRPIHDRALAQARKYGYFDAILANEKDEITESTIANVVILQKGRFYTPPLESGLLPGTLRRHLMESPEVRLEEYMMTRDDLIQADAVFLCNSLRGLFRIRLA